MPLVGTGVCALPSSRGTLRCVWRAKVVVIPRGRESLGETMAGVRELLGVFWGCAGDCVRVWLGAAWLEALHPPGRIREDGLDQLSISFGFLS